MQDPITLKSGASLQVGIASFADGMRLLKTVARELAVVNFELDLSKFAELSGKDINVLKNAVLQLLQSDAVEAALFKCASKSLYNGQSVVADTFNPELARPDYLPVAWEVMKANLSPFFAGLALSSLASELPTTSAPTPES